MIIGCPLSDSTVATSNRNHLGITPQNLSLTTCRTVTGVRHRDGTLWPYTNILYTYGYVLRILYMCGFQDRRPKATLMIARLHYVETYHGQVHPACRGALDVVVKAGCQEGVCRVSYSLDI